MSDFALFHAHQLFTPPKRTRKERAATRVPAHQYGGAENYSRRTPTITRLKLTMKQEIKAGVDFLKRMAVTRGDLDGAKAELFAENLQKLLCEKYKDHWYPDCPSKGQAFRCIRINRSIPCDEVVLQACKETNIMPTSLGFPSEMTLWIDPLEVSARSKENNSPFKVASFDKEEEDENEECVKDDLDVSSLDSLSQETSDYHSATSSDCGSAASSDTEEEAKDGDVQGEKEKEGRVAEKGKMDESCKITMVPRIRKPHEDGSNRVKYPRNMVPPNLQVIYHPTPAWPQYKKRAPVFLSTVPPPPAQQVVGYYVVPRTFPQFIIPQAPLQPWRAGKE
ncbi:protein BTG3 isoform X3 [Oreochromis niloticus]|uniref:protein BTG3 isoform X3 n=1 Tax=Oreochromis niloticus TaxID=8128 RepID=UPI000DF14FF6|nr:protein BTG3 isoform X3 [Oreochromis niloticus]